MMILLKYLFLNLAICVSIILISESDTNLNQDISLNEANIIELEAISPDYPIINEIENNETENSEINNSKLWLLDRYTIAIW